MTYRKVVGLSVYAVESISIYFVRPIAQIYNMHASVFKHVFENTTHQKVSAYMFLFFLYVGLYKYMIYDV